MLVVFFLIVIYTDWRWQRIYNALTYPVMLIGLVFGALEGFPGELFAKGFIDHLVALVAAFAFTYPVYAIGGGLKAGDAKYLMAVGALRGTGFLLASTVYGALLGGLAAVGIIVYRLFIRRGSSTLQQALKSFMPYGVALAFGGLIAAGLELAGVITLGFA